VTMTAEPERRASREEAAAERRLRALVAEILRHERVKRRRGRESIEDRALHARARHIAGGVVGPER
jgi:hypothetical protein